jgi:hypothetical protein
MFLTIRPAQGTSAVPRPITSLRSGMGDIAVEIGETRIFALGPRVVGERVFVEFQAPGGAGAIEQRFHISGSDRQGLAVARHGLGIAPAILLFPFLTCKPPKAGDDCGAVDCVQLSSQRARPRFRQPSLPIGELQSTDHRA